MSDKRSALVFLHSRDGAVKIDAEPLALMRTFEQHGLSALEAGGLLMGRLLSNDRDVVIDKITLPMPGDVRSRFGFFRAAGSHGHEVARAWEESGGTCILLGDWHTHAEPRPIPSGVDLDNWRKMLREATPGEARFFVIVGQSEVAAWEGDTRTGAIRKLEARP